MALTIIFFVLFIVLFFGIYPRQSKNRSQNLLDYYHGKFCYPLGDLVIPYKNQTFYISRIARGGGVNNTSGGSYPLIWAYVEKTKKTFIGHVQAKDYTLGKFLILPKLQKNMKQSGNQLLLATEDLDIFLKNLMLDNLHELFQKEFQHLTLSSEIHIIDFLPKKKFLLKYTGVTEEIYQNPELLKQYLDNILTILDQLNIKITPS